MTKEELNDFFKNHEGKIKPKSIVYMKLNEEAIKNEENKDLFSELIAEIPAEDLLGHMEEKYERNVNPEMDGIIKVRKISSEETIILLHPRHIKEIYLIGGQELRTYVSLHFK